MYSAPVPAIKGISINEDNHVARLEEKLDANVMDLQEQIVNWPPLTNLSIFGKKWRNLKLI